MAHLLRNRQRGMRFKINSRASLHIRFPRTLQKIGYGDFGDIVLIRKNEKSLLIAFTEPVFFYLDGLRGPLKRALIKKEELPKEISMDIGLMWEEIMQDRMEPIPYFECEGQKGWEGLSYQAWGTPRENATWLYMKDGIIYLEITPLYPWTFDTPQPDEDYYTYEEFVKNYKPIATYILDQQTAQQWLEQAIELRQIIDENAARARKAYYAQE